MHIFIPIVIISGHRVKNIVKMDTEINKMRKPALDDLA